MLLFRSRETDEVVTSNDVDFTYSSDVEAYIRSDDYREFYTDDSISDLELFDELTLDEYVNYHREKRLLTRKEVYEQIGLTASTYYRLEHGKRISKKNLRLVAKWLGLSVQMLPKVKGE